MANITSTIPNLAGINNASMLDSTLSPLKEGLNRLSGGLQIRLLGDEESAGQRGGASLLALGERAAGDRASLDLQTLNQATLQVNDGIAMTQVASAGLDSIQSDLQRLHKLVLASRSGTLSDEDRLALQQQAQQIHHSINQKVHSTRYNGVPLLASTRAILMQTGIDGHTQTTLNMPDLSNTFTPADLSSTIGGEAALLAVQREQIQVGTAHAQLKAQKSELMQALDALESRALSRMGGGGAMGRSEGAESVAQQIVARIRGQATMAFQVQANQTAVRVQQLL